MVAWTADNKERAMRQALRPTNVAALICGVLLQLVSLTVLEFWPGVSTNGCAGCAPGTTPPVFSMVWFVVLAILVIVAIGGIFIRVLAEVGTATTLSSVVILWVFVTYYVRGSPLWNLNLWAVPLDWIGAGIVVAVLVRAIVIDAGRRRVS